MVSRFRLGVRYDAYMTSTENNNDSGYAKSLLIKLKKDNNLKTVTYLIFNRLRNYFAFYKKKKSIFTFLKSLLLFFYV